MEDKQRDFTYEPRPTLFEDLGLVPALKAQRGRSGQNLGEVRQPSLGGRLAIPSAPRRGKELFVKIPLEFDGCRFVSYLSKTLSSSARA